MKRIISLLVALLLVLGTFAIASAEDKAQIDVWFCLTGKNADALNAIANAFNESQDKYQVNFIFAGSYNDALTKYLSTPVADRPDILCVNALGMRPVIDDKGYFNMQKLVDEGKFDVSVYPESLLHNFSNQDGLYAMVQNLTVPVISYNKTYLEKVGCTPDDLATWDGVVAVADKMVAAGLCSYGFGFCKDTWILEQMIGMLGESVLDNDNGRDGYATKLECSENGSLLKVLETVDAVLANDSCYLAANASSARDDCSAGVVGMYCTTAGTWGNMLANCVNGYEFGQTVMPAWDTENEYNSVYPSGAGFFIVDKGDMDRIYAANDFINWFCSDDMQLLWCMETGYLPISSSVLYSDQYQEYVKNVNPGIQRVIEEMFNKSTGTDPHFGSLSEWRAAAQSVLTQLDEDAGYTPAQAVEDLKAQINDAIELYNLSNY
ncbi:MAG: extracellular solute-binding protein [Clostridia bacterium]|nr:extracellular solute-binding protein [Clostridia bacterium]